MRSNSGSGDSNNNLRDPTLRDREREQGKSGEASLEDKEPGKRQTSEGGPAKKG